MIQKEFTEYELLLMRDAVELLIDKICGGCAPEYENDLDTLMELQEKLK